MNDSILIGLWDHPAWGETDDADAGNRKDIQNNKIPKQVGGMEVQITGGKTES